MAVSVVTALLVVGCAVLIYAVPWVRATYPLNAPYLAVAALLFFMVVRSMRENTMRLALADGRAYRSARVTLLCVGGYVLALGMLYLAHCLTMTSVAAAFACGEVLIFFFLLRYVRYSIHGGDR
jgi:hypothetical protein